MWLLKGTSREKVWISAPQHHVQDSAGRKWSGGFTIPSWVATTGSPAFSQAVLRRRCLQPGRDWLYSSGSCFRTRPWLSGESSVQEERKASKGSLFWLGQTWAAARSSLFWWSAIPSRTRRSRSSTRRRRGWRRSFSRRCCVRGTDDSASRDAECWSVSITSLATLPSSSWTTSNWSSSHPSRQPIRNQ